MKTDFTYGLKKILEYFFSAAYPQLQLEALSLKSLKESFHDSFYQDFYNISLKICELEALTFQTEENKSNLVSLQNEFNNYISQLNSFLFSVGVVITLSEGRLIAAIFCCFMEWCENVNYFKLSEVEQKVVLQESPLLSLNIFLS